MVARRGPTTIVRTRHGLTLAAGGIDASNVARGSRRAAARGPRRLRPRDPADIAERTGAQRRRRGHRHRRAGLARGPDRHRDRRRRTPRHSRSTPAGSTPTATSSRSPLRRSPTRSPGSPSWPRASSAAGRSRWSAAAPTWCCPPGEDGPGAAALVRPEGADLFGYGAREAVLRALRGERRRPRAVRRPGRPEELRRVLVRGRADGRATPASWRRVRIVAFAHGWRAEDPAATAISGCVRSLRRLCAPPTRDRGKPNRGQEPAKSDRQKVIDDIKKKQKGAEKRRGMMIVGVCVVIALLIVGAAAYQPIKNWWDLRQFNDVDLASIGAPGLGLRRRHQEGRRRSQRPPDHRRAGHLRGRSAGVRPALERGRRRAGADRQAVLHRRRPPRARVARAQPRARLHDPLVRRDRSPTTPPR